MTPRGTSARTRSPAGCAAFRRGSPRPPRWIGRLDASRWEITGAGTTYLLPRNAAGGIVYGTAEGVSWIAPDQVVMVSDKAKPRQPHRCRAKDQSIHIFRIPAGAGP